MASAEVVTTVVGGNGFVGTELRRLLNQKKIGYQNFTRENPITQARFGKTYSSAPESLNTVFWLASSSVPADVERHPELIDQEVAQFRIALEHILESNCKAHVVLLSSATVVYESNPNPVDENSPIHPFNRYGQLKLALEQVLIGSGANFTILRVTNAYGPGQRVGRNQGVIGEWLWAARERKPLVLIGDRGIKRDFVHIQDVAHAMLLARSKNAVNQIFNIGSGITTSLGEILMVIRDVVGYEMELEHAEARSLDRESIEISIRNAELKLRWQPRVSLQRGITDWWADLTHGSKGS